MRRVTVAALAFATACGGGAPKPVASTPAPATTSATPSPTPTPTALATPALTADTKAVRDAAARTLAACPCELEVSFPASGRDGIFYFRGVYDPRTQTTVLEESRKSGLDLRLRFVDGRTFLSVDGAWAELDFSKVPGKKAPFFSSFVLADPRIALGVAATVASAAPSGDRHGATFYDVTYDVVAAAPKVGRWAPMLKRMMPPGQSVYGTLGIVNGRVERIVFDTPEIPGKPRFAVGLILIRTGVAAPRVGVPRTFRTIDAANEDPFD